MKLSIIKPLAESDFKMSPIVLKFSSGRWRLSESPTYWVCIKRCSCSPILYLWFFGKDANSWYFLWHIWIRMPIAFFYTWMKFSRIILGKAILTQESNAESHRSKRPCTSAQRSNYLAIFLFSFYVIWQDIILNLWSSGNSMYSIPCHK